MHQTAFALKQFVTLWEEGNGRCTGAVITQAKVRAISVSMFAPFLG